MQRHVLENGVVDRHRPAGDVARRRHRVGTEDAWDLDGGPVSTDRDLRPGHADLLQCGVATLDVDREPRDAHALCAGVFRPVCLQRETVPRDAARHPSAVMSAVAGFVVGRVQGEQPGEITNGLMLDHAEHATEVESIGRDAHPQAARAVRRAQLAVAGDRAAIQAALAPEARAETLRASRPHELGPPETDDRSRAGRSLDAYGRLLDLRVVQLDGGPRCTRRLTLRGCRPQR